MGRIHQVLHMPTRCLPLSELVTFSQEKFAFCPERMEFVGHDVCSNGNRPAMSKRALLEHWPTFVTALDIAYFIGYLIFYSIYIPYFEQPTCHQQGRNGHCHF